MTGLKKPVDRVSDRICDAVDLREERLADNGNSHDTRLHGGGERLVTSGYVFGKVRGTGWRTVSRPLADLPEGDVVLLDREDLPVPMMGNEDVARLKVAVF